MYLCTVKLFPTIDNHTSNGVLGRTASQSFTAWTRGGSQVDEESTEVTGEDGDPFSHVLPILIELIFEPIRFDLRLFVNETRVTCCMPSKYTKSYFYLQITCGFY